MIKRTGPMPFQDELLLMEDAIAANKGPDGEMMRGPLVLDEAQKEALELLLRWIRHGACKRGHLLEPGAYKYHGSNHGRYMARECIKCQRIYYEEKAEHKSFEMDAPRRGRGRPRTKNL